MGGRVVQSLRVATTLLDNSWSNAETELRRRYDLVPNLVEAIPSRLIAALARFDRAEYFELEPAVRVAGPPATKI